MHIKMSLLTGIQNESFVFV